MKLEFNWVTNKKTNSQNLQLLNDQLTVIAVLDQHDFKRMNSVGKNEGNLKDVVTYCNQCKGTDIKDFIPTVF